LPGKSTLVAIASGKPNHVATIHMSKGAAKSARLDLAAVRKRASSKGDLVAEVKPGETITGLAVGWTVEMFVKAVEEKPAAKKEGKKKEAKPTPAKKAAPAKKVKPAKATPKAKPAAKKKKK